MRNPSKKKRTSWKESNKESQKIEIEQLEGGQGENGFVDEEEIMWNLILNSHQNISFPKFMNELKDLSLHILTPE